MKLPESADPELAVVPYAAHQESTELTAAPPLVEGEIIDTVDDEPTSVHPGAQKLAEATGFMPLSHEQVQEGLELPLDNVESQLESVLANAEGWNAVRIQQLLIVAARVQNNPRIEQLAMDVIKMARQDVARLENNLQRIALLEGPKGGQDEPEASAVDGADEEAVVEAEADAAEVFDADSIVEVGEVEDGELSAVVETPDGKTEKITIKDTTALLLFAAADIILFDGDHSLDLAAKYLAHTASGGIAGLTGIDLKPFLEQFDGASKMHEDMFSRLPTENLIEWLASLNQRELMKQLSQVSEKTRVALFTGKALNQGFDFRGLTTEEISSLASKLNADQRNKLGLGFVPVETTQQQPAQE